MKKSAMGPSSYPPFIYKAGITDFLAQVPMVFEDADKDEALAAIGETPHGVVLLVDKPNSRKVTGIITQFDLRRLSQEPRPTKAKDLATYQGVVGIRGDAKLWQLLRLINGDNKRGMSLDQVPVVDYQGNALGVVTRDLIREKIDSVAASF